jgi:hypothetical protein
MMPSKQLTRRNTDLQSKTKAELADGKQKNLILAKVQRMPSKQLIRNTKSLNWQMENKEFYNL